MNALPDGVTRETWGGIDVLRVETPFSTARISLHGAQVLSFVPTGFDDLLWVSPTTALPPKAIRGGVPVCWPYFGKQGQPDDAVQHGHARISRWPLTEVKREADGSAVLKLALPLRDGVPLELQMSLHVGRELRQSIDTAHRGDAPYRLTQALHTYFRVADATQVRVTGLDGLRYDDKYDGGTHVQSGEWSLHDPRDPGRSDRIYTQARGHYVLRDPGFGRSIDITTQGSRSAVVWNAGEAAAAKMDDIGAGWRNYVCVEAGNVGPDLIELAPGGSHVLKQVFEVRPL